jgi:hypothetical protein
MAARRGAGHHLRGLVLGANLILLDPGKYVASQTPLQALLIAASAALTLWLVARMRIERERSESQWLESEALADLSRVLGSTTEFDDLYGQAANNIRNLIPFDRMSLLIIDGERGSMSLRYIDGVNEFASTDDRMYEVKLASFAADTTRPARVSRGSTVGAQPVNEEGMFDSSLAPSSSTMGVSSVCSHSMRNKLIAMALSTSE